MLPVFLFVCFSVCRPFDAATYEDEVDDDDIMDEEGRTRLKLKVSNNCLVSAQCGIGHCDSRYVVFFGY